MTLGKAIDIANGGKFKRRGWKIWAKLDSKDYLVSEHGDLFSVTSEDIKADDYIVHYNPEKPPVLLDAFLVFANSSHTCDEGRYENHLNHDVVVKVYKE